MGKGFLYKHHQVRKINKIRGQDPPALTSLSWCSQTEKILSEIFSFRRRWRHSSLQVPGHKILEIFHLAWIKNSVLLVSQISSPPPSPRLRPWLPALVWNSLLRESALFFLSSAVTPDPLGTDPPCASQRTCWYTLASHRSQQASSLPSRDYPLAKDKHLPILRATPPLKS